MHNTNTVSTFVKNYRHGRLRRRRRNIRRDAKIIDNLIEDNLGLQEKANYWIEMARSLKNEIDFLCEYAGLQPVWCDTIKLTGIPHTPISPDKFRNALIQYLKMV